MAERFKIGVSNVIDSPRGLKPSCELTPYTPNDETPQEIIEALARSDKATRVRRTGGKWTVFTPEWAELTGIVSIYEVSDDIFDLLRLTSTRFELLQSGKVNVGFGFRLSVSEEFNAGSEKFETGYSGQIKVEDLPEGPAPVLTYVQLTPHSLSELFGHSPGKLEFLIRNSGQSTKLNELGIKRVVREDKPI